MKKINILLIITFGGFLFTVYILNNNKFYAKEKYNLYAFQVGAYNDKDNAKKISENKSIIINEDGLYKVIIGVYKDIDVVNKMLVYFENNNINIYIKSIEVNKDIYNSIDFFENIIKKTNDNHILEKTNDSIIQMYNEVINNEIY